MNESLYLQNSLSLFSVKAKDHPDVIKTAKSASEAVEGIENLEERNKARFALGHSLVSMDHAHIALAAVIIAEGHPDIVERLMRDIEPTSDQEAVIRKIASGPA